MANIYAWDVVNLERETEDGFVFTAHYTVSAKSEDEVYSSGAYGSIGFQRPENLIPFSDLSKELVVSWVQEAIGGDEKVAEIQAALDAQIEEQRHPTKAAGVPWAG
jgi:hypothetical protein